MRAGRGLEVARYLILCCQSGEATRWCERGNLMSNDREAYPELGTAGARLLPASHTSFWGWWRAKFIDGERKRPQQGSRRMS